MDREYLIRIDHFAGVAELVERYGRVMGDFEGIELVLPGEDPYRLIHEIGVSEELARVAGNRKVTVGALAARCIATDVDETLDLVTGLLAVAAAIGARCLNLTIPPVRRNREDHGFVRYQDALNFTHTLLRRIRLEAESSGVAVALEAATGGCLLSPVELREIIDSANSWAVGACVDVGRIGALGSPADWLDTLKHRLHSVRLPGPDGRGARGAGRGRATLEEAGIAEVLDEISYERLIVLRAAPAED